MCRSLTNIALQDGTEVFFKLKRKTPLKKLMDAWHARAQGGPPGIAGYRFIYHNRELDETQTPDDVGMESDIQNTVDAERPRPQTRKRKREEKSDGREERRRRRKLVRHIHCTCQRQFGNYRT